jgi:transglutaminase-like putative cysteine protease
VRVLENIEADSYVIVLTQDLDVSITDEFLPFLYPNQYVNFSADSRAVKLGQELAQGLSSDLEVLGSIYHYVIENISYDTEKAENIQYGYTPVIDDTLASGSGICFDYAALMTAMLRSQGIPTKLETGYSGQAYHAWISAYVDDIGWIDNVIEFDGSAWHLLDPTLAANNDPSAVSQYIGDGSNYTLKYTY